MSRKQICASIIGVLLCAGCGAKQSLDTPLVATAEYLEQNPLPKPEFIVSYPSTSNDPLCVEIRQGLLGEDTEAEIYINNQSVGPMTVWIGGSAILESGQEFSSRKIFCFDNPGLPLGVYIAGIELTTTSDKSYTYFWTFHVNESEPNVTSPIGLPTLAVLPSLTPSSTP